MFSQNGLEYWNYWYLVVLAVTSQWKKQPHKTVPITLKEAITRTFLSFFSFILAGIKL